MHPNPRPSSSPFNPDFDRIADRWEQWWRRENGTALIYQTTMPPDAVARGVPTGRLLDKLDNAEAWLEAREAQLKAEVRHGDAVPSIRIDLGPVATAAFLGSRVEVAAAEDTVWQHPILDDLESIPELEISDDNPWWVRVQELTKRLAERAAGRYAVCLPDLSGPTDILASLRGSEELCLDLFEEREVITETSMRLVDAWEKAFRRLNELAHEAGAATVHWLGCWSDTVYTVPTCDFNALIGPRDFNELCLPTYREQARRAGRVCFHLDGPDAARHAEALANAPELTAIQYTPGAGTPSAMAKLDMLHMLQEAGKPILVITPPDEVEALQRHLAPQGLALWIA